MKITKAYLFLSLLLAISFSEIYAQAPEGFKYQGVARDANGAVYASEMIQLQFALLETDGSDEPSAIYEEQHEVMTSPQGVFSVNVGEGTPLTGSFQAADWAQANYSLQIKFRSASESDFIDLGSSLLLSVPYAMHANTVSDKDDADADPSNEIQQLSLDGNNLQLSPGGGSVQLNQLGSSPWLTGTSSPSIYYNGKVGIDNINPRAALSIGANFNDSLWTVPAITVGGSGTEGGALEMGNDQHKLRIYATTDRSNRIETAENNQPGTGILNILARQVSIGREVFKRDQNYPLAIRANVQESHCLLLESEFDDHRWELYPNSATNQLFLIYNGEAIGYFNPNTGIYTAGVSDKRRKEQITTLPPVADRYPELSVYEYNYLSTPQKRYTGLLAQELQQVFPGLVSTVKMDGREEVLIVDYDQLTALNTAATKEQQSYIQQLEEKVSTLEEKIAKQEERLAKIEALLEKN